MHYLYTTLLFIRNSVTLHSTVESPARGHLNSCAHACVMHELAHLLASRRPMHRDQACFQTFADDRIIKQCQQHQSACTYMCIFVADSDGLKCNGAKDNSTNCFAVIVFIKCVHGCAVVLPKGKVINVGCG
jgi:hypothetical protein